MEKSAIFLMELEIKNSMKYIESRKKLITVNEVMQEFGNLKSVISKLKVESQK